MDGDKLQNDWLPGSLLQGYQDKRPIRNDLTVSAETTDVQTMG